MQDDEAGHARHSVSRVGLLWRAGPAPFQARPYVLWLLGVSDLQVRAVATPGGGAVPEVRGALHRRARGPQPDDTVLRARGLRIPAGGRTAGGMTDPLAAFLLYLDVEK